LGDGWCPMLVGMQMPAAAFGVFWLPTIRSGTGPPSGCATARAGLCRAGNVLGVTGWGAAGTGRVLRTLYLPRTCSFLVFDWSMHSAILNAVVLKQCIGFWEQREQMDKAADIPTYLLTCDFAVWIVSGNVRALRNG